MYIYIYLLIHIILYSNFSGNFGQLFCVKTSGTFCQSCCVCVLVLIKTKKGRLILNCCVLIECFAEVVLFWLFLH